MKEQRAIVCGVVILAAGASVRMGRPKMLLPWGATSVLGHLIGQWQALGAEQTAVVCAAGDLSVPEELRRIGFLMDNCIINPTPESGMFSSIQSAARWPGWKPNLTHWIILLGDQPHLRPETLRTLLEFAAAQPERICQPSRGGRPRHPVVLPAATFAQLKDASPQTLKQFLQTRSDNPALCEMDDHGLDMDIDQPADYEKALQIFLTKA